MPNQCPQTLTARRLPNLDDLVSASSCYEESRRLICFPRCWLGIGKLPQRLVRRDRSKGNGFDDVLMTSQLNLGLTTRSIPDPASLIIPAASY